MNKNLFKLIFFALVVGISLSSFGRRTTANRGNGNLTSSERAVSAFQQINSSGFAEIRFFASDEQRVIVTADSNLHESVEISTRNNVLNIRTKSGNYRFTKLVVEIHSPTLTGVTMSGSGKFIGMDKIIAPNFRAVLSGSGRIEGAFQSDNFSARVSGSGRIETMVESSEFSANISGSGRILANGTSEKTDITISGSGRFNGDNFSTTNAKISVSGSGSVDICVDESLEARVAGSGKVNYCGNPTNVRRNIAGSGRIRPM